MIFICSTDYLMATYSVGKGGEQRRKQIADSFQKGEEAQVGTIREHSGHEYIKTEDGWKYHNKGVGKIKVQAGHKIVTKEGVHGDVKHRDQTHTYIEHKTESGQSKVSKVKNEDVDNNIVGHNYQHYVPSDKVKSTDPKDIKDMAGGFQQMNEFFKDDKDMKQVLDLIQPLVEQNKNIKFDPDMKFDSDKVLGLSYPDGRVGINANSKFAGDKEEVYRTFVHETIHAITRDKIDTNEVLQDELKDVLSYVKKQAAEDGQDHYGLTNVHEMVAEIFSNKDFYNYLSQMKVSDKKKNDKKEGNVLDNMLRKVFTAIAACFSKDVSKIKKVKGDKNIESIADYLIQVTKATMNKKPSQQAIEKSDVNELSFEEQFDILKGKLAAAIGTKKMMGGRMYIKAIDGWKYFGQGGGDKAQSHAGSSKKQQPVVAKQEPVKQGKQKQSAKNIPVEQEVTAQTKPTAESPKIDINERFQAAARQTKAVIKGAAKCQILYGTGGVGKTYGVTHQLEAAGMKAFDEDINQPANSVQSEGAEEGEEKSNDKDVKSTDYDYVKITGKMTAPQVYKALYEHNGKTILFDDCDSVLRDNNSVNLFKGALDSSGDGTVSYGTSTGVKDDNGDKLPKRFKFNGKAIFISNLASEDVPQPIKSRALRADLSMTPEQTIDRLKFIAKNKEGKYQNLKFKGIGNYSHKDMEEIIGFLDKHKHNTSDLNVRTVGSILAIKHIADEEGSDWRKDAEHMIFSKSQENDFYNGGLLKSRQNAMMKAYGADRRIEKAKACGKMGAKSEMYKGEEIEAEPSDADNDMEKGGQGSGRKVGDNVNFHSHNSINASKDKKGTGYAKEKGTITHDYGDGHYGVENSKGFIAKVHHEKNNFDKAIGTDDVPGKETVHKSQKDDLNKSFEILGL